MRPLGRRLGFGFGLCFSLGENRSRSRRGGKVGISRFGRDFQGSVGAGENLSLVFHGFHAPALPPRLGLLSRINFTPSRSNHTPRSSEFPASSSPAPPASGGAFPPSPPP